MMYSEFIEKIEKFAFKHEGVKSHCTISYDYYKKVVEPHYMKSTCHDASDYCKKYCMRYIG